MEEETTTLAMNSGSRESWEKLQKYGVSKDREKTWEEGERENGGGGWERIHMETGKGRRRRRKRGGKRDGKGGRVGYEKGEREMKKGEEGDRKWGKGRLEKQGGGRW